MSRYDDWGARLERFLKDDMDARSFTLTLRYEIADGAGPDDWPSRAEIDLELTPFEFGPEVRMEVEETSWTEAYLANAVDQLIKQLQELKK